MSKLARQRIAEAKKNGLTTLDLSNCGLSSIPKALVDVENLQSLYLRNNKIRDLSVLSDLKHLQYLDLMNNKITDISLLSALKKLQHLELINNKIRDLSVLSTLNHLQYLDLRNNKIRDVSPLSALNNLQYLDLMNNEISDLSALVTLIETGLAVSLNYPAEKGKISLGNNPLTTPPIEIIEQGNQAILNYFNDLQEQGSGQINEAKLIIVGEPGAGKTTLMETLLDPNYQLLDNTESTLGIDVRENWRFSHPDKTQNQRQLTANIWDFGGQQIQYMTHQFFLTPDASYVLLSANDRKEPANFPYWFKIIHLLGEEQGRYSPVLVVLNKKNDQFINFNFDLKFYQDRYPELSIQVCEVDLSVANRNDDLDYGVLRKKIQTQLSQLPHVNDDRPARWNDIRLELRRVAKHNDYIDFEQYAEICQKYQVNNQDSQLLLSSYLHRLGNLLHFANDPALREVIILKPQWAVDAVYSVLADKEIANN